MEKKKGTRREQKEKPREHSESRKEREKYELNGIAVKASDTVQLSQAKPNRVWRDGAKEKFTLDSNDTKKVCGEYEKYQQPTGEW